MDSPALASNGLEHKGDAGALQEEHLRLFIREELVQGLRGLCSELQVSLRLILHEELLPRSVQEKQQDVGHVGSCAERHAPTQAKPASQPEAADALRQAADTKRMDMALPGATESEIDSPLQCACGNTFLDDALFCRKCGEPRPNVCACGNLLKDDAKFCRKCGRSREVAVNKTITIGTTAEDGLPKKKKANKDKKQKTALFKPKEVEVTETKLQHLTAHRYYEIFSGTLIICNSVFLGYQTQFMAETYNDSAKNNVPLRDPPDVFFAFHCIFCVLFSVELGLRWVAEGLIPFFKTAEIWWNVLDIVVVSSSALEILFEVIAQATNTEKTDALQSVSVIRVLRIVRIVRVARVIRVMKFFRELRMMIFSILGCMKNLVWVLVILAMTFFMFGVAFTTATCEFLDTTAKWQDPDHEELVEAFGTIDKAILSLFMAMSGGNDWAAYYVPLLPLPFYYRFAFLLFIAFSIFAVVNIVTGIFVESALQANLKDRDVIVHEELEAKQEYLQSMQDLFEEMDEDDAGTITTSEFEEKLKDERVIAYFNALKLDVSDAKTVFQLLDHDRSGEVGIDEFLEGCYKLQGESRSLDMKIMQYEVQYLQEHFTSFEQILEDVRTALNIHKSTTQSKPPEECEFGKRTLPELPVDAPPQLPGLIDS